MTRTSPWLGLALAMSWWPAAAMAAPVFTLSSIEVSSESPPEGELMEFRVRLRNSGDGPAEHAQLSVEGPQMGYLIDVSGLKGITVDHEARKITSSVNLPAGGELPIRLQVLTPRNSGGDALSISVHLAHYASGAELWEHKTVTIDTRRDHGGIKLGPGRLQPAGVGFVIWLVLTIGLWMVFKLVARRSVNRETPRGATKPRSALDRPGSLLRTVAAIMIPIGFWMVFGAMAWRDFRTLTAWKEAKATIVGRRTLVHTENDSRVGRGAPTNTNSTTYTPEFALRYEVDGADVLSTGYETGSSIHIGGHAVREQEMREWIVGAVISCWYDPDNPQDVIVRRGFGGAYFFAIIPIPVFWFGLISIRRIARQ